MLSTIQTKAFWFFTLLYPIIFALPILGLVAVFALLEDEETDLNEMFAGGFQGVVEEMRFRLRGQVLYYCVVDETANLSDRIRYQIDKRDRDIWASDRHRNQEEYTVEDYREYRERRGLKTFDWYPELSLNRFREYEEAFDSIETLNRWLQQEKISGYFVLPKNLVDTNQGARFVVKKDLTLPKRTHLNELKRWFEYMTTQALREIRFLEQIDDTDQLEDLIVKVSVDHVSLKPSATVETSALSKQEQSTKTSTITIVDKITSIPYIALLALIWGGGSYLVLTSSIEEKTSKVGEILFSSIDPLSLMDGKVLGNVIVVGIGLGAWLFIIGLPTLLLLSDSVLLVELLHPLKILNFIIFCAFAFSSFGYLNAALGSACSDIKDTMYVNQPFALIGFFVILPMLIYVLIQPESSFASVMSFIPPFSPLFMIARTAALPSLPTYLLIVLIMSASLVLIRQLSVRIYTPGLLLERKIVSLRSLFRLARQTG